MESIHRIGPFAAILLSLAASSLTVSAQSIYGTVTQPDGTPLPGTQIVIASLGVGAISDADGHYSLSSLPAGDYVVSFRFVGFRTEDVPVVLRKESVRVDVVLEAQAVRLDEAIVTAEDHADALLSRSTRSVTTLDLKAIEVDRGQTLGDLLEGVAGVSALSTGPSISKPVIRGLHGQRLVVLNEGVQQEGQQWGGEHAPEIDPFAPGSVEVIRGAAGVEYGVGAIGGVIRVESAQLPTDGPVRGRLSLNGFSNNRQAATSLEVEGAVEAVRGLGWRAQGSMRKAGASKTPDYVIGNSAFSELNGSATLGIERDRIGAHLHVSHFGTNLGLYRGAHIGNVDDLLRAIERGQPLRDYSFSYGIDPPKQTIRHDLVSARGHLAVPSGDWLEAQYGFQSNRRSEYDAHRRFGDPLDRPAFSLALTTHTLDLKLRQRPRGRFLGVIGLSGMNQGNVNQEAGYLIPNFRGLTYGAYARQSWISNFLTLEVGLRYDARWMRAFPRESLSSGSFVRRVHSYRSLSGVAGAIWRLSAHWSVATNLSSAWRPPGVNELYNFGVHHGTAQFEVGDPSLGPERSLSADMTARHVSDRSVLEISMYANRMNGYIGLWPEAEPRVTIRGTFPSFRYTQTDAVLRGMDGSFEYTLVEWLRASAAASVVRGSDVTTDRPLIFMPADRLSAEVALSRSRFGAVETPEIGIEARLVARQDRVPAGVDFSEPPSGYRLLAVHASGRLVVARTPIDISITVENLLNTRYRDYLSRFRYFIDEPGRSAILRIHVPLGPSTP